MASGPCAASNQQAKAGFGLIDKSASDPAAQHAGSTGEKNGLNGHGACRASAPACFSGVAEQRPITPLIEAQSAAIARAMASICNDEQGRYGVMSGA
jgi:hypothetical protein